MDRSGAVESKPAAAERGAAAGRAAPRPDAIDPATLTPEAYRTLQIERSLVHRRTDCSDRARYLIDRLRPCLAEAGIDAAASAVLCVGCRNGYELDALGLAGFGLVAGIDLHSVDPRILVMDMHATAFPDGAFDVVFASHVLEHALDPGAAGRELRRIVRPGGLIVAEVPIFYGVRGADLWDYESPERVAALLEPCAVVWSETGPQIDADHQRVARVIVRADAPTGPAARPADSARRDAGPASGVGRVVRPARVPFDRLAPRLGDVWYSMRRYYVDEFYTRHVEALPRGAAVLDVGGKRHGKRGQFDLSAWPVRATYLNLDPRTRPDLLADAARIPAAGGSFDAVILSEVVEHLADPAAAVVEAGRVLKQGGVLLACSPFLFPIHPDPIDVSRCGPEWWRRTLAGAGFADAEIEPQGAYFSVLADMLRAGAARAEEVGAWPASIREPGLRFVRWARESALSMERDAGLAEDAFFGSYATGYGVRAVRGPTAGARP